MEEKINSLYKDIHRCYRLAGYAYNFSYLDASNTLKEYLQSPKRVFYFTCGISKDKFKIIDFEVFWKVAGEKEYIKLSDLYQ